MLKTETKAKQIPYLLVAGKLYSKCKFLTNLSFYLYILMG